MLSFAGFHLGEQWKEFHHRNLREIHVRYGFPEQVIQIEGKYSKEIP